MESNRPISPDADRAWDGQVVASSGGAVLTREHAGLLAVNDFRRIGSVVELEADFELNGSAPPPHRCLDFGAEGLRIGVQRHAPAVWEGFFAVSHAAYPDTSIFHVEMARDRVGVPRSDRSGEAVFAVQTASTKETGVLNYVLAASTTNGGRTRWVVGHAKGLYSDAALTVLWQSASLPSACAEFVQEITLRTDGQSSFHVWFGGSQVYAADHGLDLEVEPPLQPYLEVQALEIGYVTTFTDYWVTEDNSIVVRGVRPGDQVCFVQSDGTRSQAVASRTGEARLTLQMPAVRGRGMLTIARADDLLFGPFPYAGGDTYRMSEGDHARLG
jgi:uncharacterized protein YneR